MTRPRLPAPAAVAARALAAALWLGALTASAPAQNQPAPEAQPAPAPAPAPTPTQPISPPAVANAGLSVSATFSGDNRPIASGIVWRVFRDGADGKPEIVSKSMESTPTFVLPAGRYIVHASYGFAGVTRGVNLRPGVNPPERVTIAAGALSLGAAIGDQPIPTNRVTFSVYVPIDSDSEGRLVVANARRGDLIRLPEGTYHVVSNYGDTNSIMRSDLKVDAGKVTEATLNHRAATVTLKLVTQPGAEALAGTAFSVLTPGGDVIREAIGAFPQLVLAEGDYVVIARQEGQIYTREFNVASGIDRDIEVIAK